MLKYLIIVTITFLLEIPLQAHGDHKNKNEMKKPDTLTIVGNDTIAINGIPTDKYLAMKSIESMENTSNSESAQLLEEKEISISSVFEHIHNKVIHFPIALSVVAFLLMLLGYKNGNYDQAIKIIIPIAVVFSIIAVFSGLNQSVPFEETSTYELVEIHELLGFGVTASLLLWLISLNVKRFEKLVWLFAVLTITLVSITGFFGGIIAH